jgi:thiamine biosynthesis lipoprotein
MNHRRNRAAEEIRRELTNLLFEGLPDGPAPLVFLDRVEIAPDLSTARVFVSPSIPDRAYDEKELAKPLQNAEPWLRQKLFQRMRIRRIPRMTFMVDRGKQNAERINTLLDRIRKRGGMGVVLLALLLQPLMQAAPPLERYEASANIMGSEFRVALYGADKKQLASVADAAFDEARRVDELLSNYISSSELSRLNRKASDGPMEVSEELFTLLERCVRYSSASEGGFDPTVGRLMKTWGFYRGEGAIPSRLSIWWTLRSVGYAALELNSKAHTVEFLRSGLQLDPGGFGKGYAVERVVELLREQGIAAAMVSSGSSTLYGLGSPPDEPRGWKADIRDPLDKDRIVATEYLLDSSLSTSGSYERSFTVDGVVYSHIMDPRTGMPATGTVAVSVVAPSSLDSEVWSTALFVNGKEWSSAAGHTPNELRVLYCAMDESCGWLK